MADLMTLLLSRTMTSSPLGIRRLCSSSRRTPSSLGFTAGTSLRTWDSTWTYTIQRRHRPRWRTATQALLASRLRHPLMLYTSDAADERSSVDLGGRRI